MVILVEIIKSVTIYYQLYIVFFLALFALGKNWQLPSKDCVFLFFDPQIPQVQSHHRPICNQWKPPTNESAVPKQ